VGRHAHPCVIQPRRACSSTEPPVRHQSSQSHDSDYFLTRGPSAHSRISLNAPLVMIMASSRTITDLSSGP
jgi:hypothetical protein